MINISTIKSSRLYIFQIISFIALFLTTGILLAQTAIEGDLNNACSAINSKNDSCLFGQTSIPGVTNVQVVCPSQCIANTSMIIGCDGRIQGPSDGTENKNPYRMVGRLSNGCSGTLIDNKFVLTAAHCIVDGNDNFRSGPIGFTLGQSGNTCGKKPFGTRYVKRAFVPEKYVGGSGTPEDKAFDYAVLELASPIAGASTMDFGHLSWNTVKNRTTTVVGYPGDKPKGATQSSGQVWYSKAGFNSQQPFKWYNSGESGIFRVYNDGYGGQSGSGMYVWYNGKRKLVGVYIGSPVSECNQGYSWAARMTPEAVERIENAMLYPPNGNVLDFSWRIKEFSGSEITSDTSC